MPTLRMVIFLLATVALQQSWVFADSLSKHPFCILTENGWTLGISHDGSAVLFRTGNPRHRLSTAAGVFDYSKITDANAIASRRYLAASTRLKYFYGQFDKPKVYPLPESASVYRLLDHAQTIFRKGKDQRLLDLIRKYPLGLDEANTRE